MGCYHLLHRRYGLLHSGSLVLQLVPLLLKSPLDELLARLADGDRAAFDPLYEQLWPVLLGFCRRRLGDNTAEDATQQALFAIFSRASLYDPGRPALPWLLAFAHWECKTAENRRNRSREVPLSELPAEGSPEADILRRDVVDTVRLVIGELSPLDEQTLWIAMYGELHDRQVSHATFRKRLERALQRFRNHWMDRHERT